MAEENQAPERLSGRRERERELRRREILNAARDVFIESGYEHATLDEVARRAEFAKGTLYSYFESKVDLFEALVDEEFSRLISDVRATVEAETDDTKSFVKGIKVAIKYIGPGPSFFSVAVAGFASREHSHTTRFHEIVMKRYLELTRLVSERFARGIRNGVFKNYDPEFLAFVLLGMVQSAGHQADRFDVVPSLGDRDVDTLCDIFLNGILKPSTL